MKVKYGSSALQMHSMVKNKFIFFRFFCLMIMYKECVAFNHDTSDFRLPKPYYSSIKESGYIYKYQIVEGDGIVCFYNDGNYSKAVILKNVEVIIFFEDKCLFNKKYSNGRIDSAFKNTIDNLKPNSLIVFKNIIGEINGKIYYLPPLWYIIREYTDNPND